MISNCQLVTSVLLFILTFYALVSVYQLLYVFKCLSLVWSLLILHFSWFLTEELFGREGGSLVGECAHLHPGSLIFCPKLCNGLLFTKYFEVEF